jgi:type IV pilus assembly protein PilQ
MKKIYGLVLVLGCMLFVASAYPQGKQERLRTKGYINPQEIVSLDSTMRMDQALLVIGELSKQFSGKVIIDLEHRKNPIGVYVVNQHWRDALDMICNHNGLVVDEESDFIRIMAANANVSSEGQQHLGPTELPPTLASRDVKISAVFFTTNLEKLQQYGISWSFYRSKPKEPTIHAYNAAGIVKGDTTSSVPQPANNPSLSKALLGLASPPEFTFANIDALVKFFGSNQIGDVVISPEVTVRNGKKGLIQVGKNIFVTTHDVGGNAISTQVQTGTIINVTPTVYTEHDTAFIYLSLSIEQSDAGVGFTGTEISKDYIETFVNLYNGEETVIGGLYQTTQQEVREGVPVLKDLPWWFFGLRYIFGSENKTNIKNELIILLKAELLDPVRDRIATHHNEHDIIEKKRAEFMHEFDKK